MEIATMAQALQLHAQVLKSGCQNPNPSTEQTQQTLHSQQNLSKLFTFSALSPSGSLSYARLILNSLQTPNSYYYNTMIRAYSDLTHPAQAISLFLAMQNPPSPSTPRPDKFTFPFVLKACSKLCQIPLGEQLHGLVWKLGFGPDMHISNALIHMYSAGGVPDLAFKVFDKMLERDVVSWTSIIDGLVDNDKPVKAIALFEHMLENDVEFNEATVVSVLRACADTGALSMGRKVHDLVKEKKLISLNGKVSTTLIDMYAKCGCIDGAKEVFSETVNKDVVTWTAMIAGLAIHGQCKEATELFDKMKGLEIKPDERTLTALLSAYRNGHMVNEGLACFRTMKKKYKIRPKMQHYGCVIGMLAQAGHLENAETFMNKIPVEPDAVLWRSLIRACQIHGDVERGERLMKHFELLKLDSNDSGAYVVHRNILVSEGKWKENGKTRALTNRKKLLKASGYSRMEINGEIYEFTTGELGHLEVEEIIGKMGEIALNLSCEGYDPKRSDLSLDDEEKAFELFHHSEKLAVSFGMIKTSPGTSIRIVKNFRPCEDCHSFMKILSKIYQRDIFLRDHVRFHHFRNGECSCGNFW
ncbi:pentatricopeptide repeat-containing protein At4g21065-like [Coffea arabica]|uniref:Pentatricopeptide repeat-containing protein At4g21065-like n=1 Tax=Coffea arabica TaxID=13443 RepID=A0A6P6WB17_COFAR|nr:pentatricopeptide repeat-containing protein At4g21065-like [Coffea arabica]